MSTTNSLELVGAGRHFGRAWIFSELTLTIRSGESVALFGNNGCGKSTLLKIFSLLLPLSRGNLKLFGEGCGENKNGLRKRLVFLGHEMRLYDSLSVLENMRLAASLRGIQDPDPIRRSLERVELHHHKNRRTGDLSFGMRKRLALARLLLGDFDLILLDEPYPSLDQDSRRILAELIGAWRKKGKTIVHASHDHELALSHADRLLILEQGRFVYDGKPK